MDSAELLAGAIPDPGVPLAVQLRELIATGLNSGAMHVGQRLPSIRTVADAFQVTTYAALQAYAAIEAEGVVERRERSGVYIAALDSAPQCALPETADWLVSVLSEACEHQLRIPELPDLITRWTTGVQVSCVCIDSCPDTVGALTHELTRRFGIRVDSASPDEISGAGRLPLRLSTLSPSLREAHFLVTTPFHACEVREFARTVGKPMLVATFHPEIAEEVESHVRFRELAVVCSSTTFADRIRGLHGGPHRDRIRPVLTQEADEAPLLSDHPVLLTRVARERINGRPFRLAAPPVPYFSSEFSRKVAALLIHLNLEARAS